MSIRNRGCYIRPLTKELSEEFATMQSTVTERPVSPRRLAFLETELACGRFHSPKWAVAYYRGKSIRVNGQHSSTMLANANGHFPTGLMVVIDEFEVDTERDLAELFERFDSPASMRTTKEVLNAHQKIETALDGIQVKDVGQIIGGIWLCSDRTGNKDFKAGERAGLVHTHQDFILWAHPLCNRKLCRVPVIAAMYLTWQKSPELAYQFWMLVRDDSHPSPNNATRTLSETLKLLTKRLAIGKSGTERKYMTRGAVVVKCIRAWNAWREDKSTLLKVMDKDVLNWPELL